MTLEELQLLLSDPSKVKDGLAKEVASIDKSVTSKQYEPATHDVMSTSTRPDKTVKTEKGTSLVKVARLAIPMQKKIVGYAAAFLAANKVKVDAIPTDQTQTDLLAVIQKTLDDCKCDYKNLTLLNLMMSELEAAEIWYPEAVAKADPDYWLSTPNEKASVRLRLKLVATSLGDTLYPVYDEYGDMIAFGRGFSKTSGDKKIECLDLYTTTTTYKYTKDDSGWIVTPEANPIGKIPVIYYRQPAVEWADVQTLIDRFETSLSRHADTNDYFGSPLVKVTGEIKGFANKGDDGKVLVLENNAEADYLTWDQSPESVKLEQQNLRSLIFDMTDTPDISIEQMKSLGTYSGIALKMLFLSAHLKAAKKEEIFGEGIQRRLNLIKAAMIKINMSLEKGKALSLKPVFEYYLPKDDTAIIDNLVSAVTGGIISKESAVENNPYVGDPSKELERMEKEQNTASGLDDVNNDE